MYIKQQFSVCLHYFISFVSSFVFPSVNVESECVSVCDFFSFFFLSLLTFFLRLYSLRCLKIFYFSLLLLSTIFISSYFYCVFIWLFCFFFASSLTMQYCCCCCCFLKLAIKITGYCKTFFYQLL